MQTRPFGKTGQVIPDSELWRAAHRRRARLHRRRGRPDRQHAPSTAASATSTPPGSIPTARRRRGWARWSSIAARRCGSPPRRRDTTRDGARRQLETSLHRLQTDHVDEWRLHNVFDYARLDRIHRQGRGAGSRHPGTRGRAGAQHQHQLPHRPADPGRGAQPLPLRQRADRLSALDHFILSFAEELLPVANAKGVATIGMKVLGLGSLTHEVERSLRYAFSLPVSTVIVGMESMAQLEQNLAIAEVVHPHDRRRSAWRSSRTSCRWYGRTRCPGSRIAGAIPPSSSLAGVDWQITCSSRSSQEDCWCVSLWSTLELPAKASAA